MRLALRLISVATVLAVILVVFQPLIWRWLFPTTPPPVVDNLAELMGLVVALIALGVGAGGYAVYHLIVDRLRVETQNQLDAQIAYLHSFVRYVIYQQLWAQGDWAREVEKGLMFKETVAAAVQTSRRYLEVVRMTGDHASIMLAKNSLAYDLASLKAEENEPEAMALVDELEREAAGNERYLETVAWVLFRFSTGESERRAKGERLIRAIYKNTRYDRLWRESLKMKYNKMFGVSL